MDNQNQNPNVINPNPVEQPAMTPNVIMPNATPEAAPAPAAAETAPAAPATSPAAVMAAVMAAPTSTPAAPVPGAAPATPVPGAPAAAGEVDVLEPEWINKAESAIAAHINDPYGEEAAVEKLQEEYLQARYGIKVADPNTGSANPGSS